MTEIPAPGVGVKYLGVDDPDWGSDPQNLALLLRYLEDSGRMDEPASYVVEKPHKYASEFREALAWRQEMIA